jgi:hypothetical protein
MNTGDKIKFLNETGGGIITRFLDPETILVKIEDGFEVPVKIKEVIPDSGSLTGPIIADKVMSKSGLPDHTATLAGIRKKNIEEITPEHENSGQILLAFTRESNPYNLKTHLINDTDYHIFYIIGLRKMGQQLYLYSGELEANTKVVLGNFRISKTDESTIFAIQYMGYKKGYYVPSGPVSSIIEINTRQLADRGYDKENEFFDVAAAIFKTNAEPSSGNTEFSKPLDGIFPKDEFLKMKETSMGKKTVTEQKKSPEVMEVDLHIQAIIDDETGLSDGEILDIQLRRFEMSLETAVRGRVKKIIFIHGVGQGKLKYEITKILNKKYPDLKYQDASFKEYGYGATMVLL